VACSSDKYTTGYFCIFQISVTTEHSGCWDICRWSEPIDITNALVWNPSDACKKIRVRLYDREDFVDYRRTICGSREIDFRFNLDHCNQ
jgi:hypothetical protein